MGDRPSDSTRAHCREKQSSIFCLQSFTDPPNSIQLDSDSPTDGIHDLKSPKQGWCAEGSNILNLSTLFRPTARQIELLEKGLSYIPTPNILDREELWRDISLYHRRIKLLDHFGEDKKDGDCRTRFTLPSNWEPTWGQLDERVRKLIEADLRDSAGFRLGSRGTDGVGGEDMEVIRELQQNKNIIFKPADKGSKIVILDKHQYVLEANRQLANGKYYRAIENSIQQNTQLQVRSIVSKLYNKKYITAKQRDFLYGPDEPRNRQFYLLPKIHKDPQTWTVPNVIPSGRPIVSDCSSATYNISLYIDHFLGPLSVKHPSYLKDTYHFLELIKPIRLPINTQLFTIDIESLYTNINTELGLSTIKNILEQHPDPKRPDAELLQLLEICLRCNDFEFAGRQYLQVQGTAMGHRYAPSYANLYMSQWECEALRKCPHKPTFYFRFLDDIIGAWPHGEYKFTEFINILNSHHPSIKVKYEIHPIQVNFLDTTVFLEQLGQNLKISTKVYFKPTDCHALLHKSSYHPKHTFKGIIKSQIIRFYRISSKESDLQDAIGILFRSLRKRGYSSRFLRTIKSSTLAGLNSNAMRGNQTQNQIQQGEQNRLMPLVTTYSRSHLPLHHQLKTNFKKYTSGLIRLQDCRVISAHRRNKNLRDMLVRAKLPEQMRRIRSGKPNHWAFKPKRFLYNPYGKIGAPILQRMSLNTSNIVYCICCEECCLLYVGETGQTLLERLKQHIYNIERNGLDTPLVLHFQIHTLQHLSITGLQTCATWTEGQRRRYERLWISRLRTQHPRGLNAV